MSKSSLVSGRLFDRVSCLSQDALYARVSIMFDASESEPKASKLDPVATEVNKALLKAASQLMLKDLSAETVKALSKAFGNFDRMVGLGRLLADAIGQPLLEHGRAHTVGLAAKYEAGKIKGAIDQYKRDVRRDAGKLDAADPKRQELLAEASNAEDAAPFLRETVDIRLAASVAPVCSAATGSRKRARQQVVEPEEDEELARAEAAVLACTKAVKRADAATEAAERTEAEKFKVYSRLANALGQAAKGCAKTSKTLASFNAFSKRVDKAERAHTLAQFATRDALMDWQRAIIEERDAELHVAELELAGCRELLAQWPAPCS